MIFDELPQSANYIALHPRFEMAFDFLRNMAAEQAEGRYDIDGDACFAVVQSYPTKTIEKAMFETHTRYIDIQFILENSETILYAPLADLKQVTEPYNAERDVTFYAPPDLASAINLVAGQFAIFFPDDGHAPGIKYIEPPEVRKVVIKVAVA